MGIKLLSSLLKSFCPKTINKIHLSSLANKKICIDTSIYLYRFKAQERLIEQFYLLRQLILLHVTKKALSKNQTFHLFVLPQSQARCVHLRLLMFLMVRYPTGQSVRCGE